MFRHAFYKASTATMARLKKFEAFKGEAGKIKESSSPFCPQFFQTGLKPQFTFRSLTLSLQFSLFTWLH